MTLGFKGLTGSAEGLPRPFSWIWVRWSERWGEGQRFERWKRGWAGKVWGK